MKKGKTEMDGLDKGKQRCTQGKSSQAWGRLVLAG